MIRQIKQRKSCDSSDDKELFRLIETKSHYLIAPQNVDYLMIEQSNYLYVGEFTGMFQETMIYRDLKLTNFLGKPLPPKVIHWGLEDILIAFSYHSAKRAQSSVTGRVAPITCFHFPMRSGEPFR